MPASSTSSSVSNVEPPRPSIPATASITSNGISDPIELRRAEIVAVDAPETRAAALARILDVAERRHDHHDRGVVHLGGHSDAIRS